MSHRGVGLAVALLVSVRLSAAAQSPDRPAGAQYQGPAFDFKPIADGVFLAVATGNLSAESNAVVVVGEQDVLIVDGETSPAAGWALLQELRSVTAKPVRQLVLTHFHYDHVHGTQSFPPEAQIMATEFTGRMLAEGQSLSHPTAVGNRNFSAAQVATLTQALDTATSDPNRRELERRRAVWREYQASVATVRPVVPNVIVSGPLRLNQGGGREIVIFHPGPAHTAGDLVVWLPKERILATGDLLQPSVPYLGDGFLAQWADVLDSLAALRPAVILPGHGEAITDLSILEILRDYLRDFWRQSAAFKTAGLTPEEAAKRLDLAKYDRHYPRPPGWTDEIVARRRVVAVRRVYQLIDGA